MTRNVDDVKKDLAANIPFSSIPEQLARMGRNWGWVLAAGILYIILGIIAIGWPVSTTVGLTLMLGVVFVVGGVIQMIHAMQFRKEAGNGWRVLQAVVALVAGILVLRFPGAGMLGVAIAMTFYFFAGAAAKGVLAMGMRPHRGWGWALASAIASFLLGAYILITFPLSAFWVPGLILGIDLIILGSSLVGVSFDLRYHHKFVEGRQITRRAA